MTARPLDSESRRRTVSAAVTIFVILFASIFVIHPVMAKINSQVTDDGKLLFTDGSFWIKWDPIGDHVVGDQFFVNGTTNISAGRIVQYDFYTRVDCHKKYCDYSDSIRNGNVTIKPARIPGINQFSILINTTGLKKTTERQSDQYIFSFTVFPSENSAKPDIFPGYYNYVTLTDNLFPEKIRENVTLNRLSMPDKSGNHYWIILDNDIAIYSYRYTVPCNQITGKTNLPAGENLYYSAFSSDDYLSIDAHVTERVLGGTVSQGEIPGINKFNITMNTSGFTEGKYFIIWNPRYNTSDRTDSISTSVFLSTFPASPEYNPSVTCPPLETNPDRAKPSISPSPASPASPSSIIVVFAALIGWAVVALNCQKRKDQ
jgi:hypothetical protein